MTPPSLPPGLARLGVHLLIAFSLFALLLRAFTWFPIESAPVVHPIPVLTARAQAQFDQLGQEKSTTLSQAHARYVREHGRLPPRGFDVWFQHARSVEACNIDSFRELYDSLEIWWGLDPSEIRRRTLELDGGNALGKIVVRNGTVLSPKKMREIGMDPGPHRKTETARALVEILQTISALGVLLPDVDMHVNGLDEPRVVIPYELRKELKDHSRKKTVREPVEELPEFHELDNAFAYDIIRQACPPTSIARQHPLSSKPGSSYAISAKYTERFTTTPGRFLVSPQLERDTWCDQPDLQDLHQTFIRPLSFSYLSQVYPVFSNSKLKGFNDILIPPWYYWFNIQPYIEEDDIVWTKKADNLFWRGSNTGGYSSGLNWIGWMRSRLVSRLNRPAEWAHQDTFLISTSNDVAKSTTLPAHAINEGFADVAFSQPDKYGDEDSLESQRLEPSFRFTGTVPFSSNYGSKAVLDLDGTAYSGRFRTLLSSKSAVFKSRLYMEAGDDALTPWFHYVPLGVRYQELYSLLAYYFGARRPLKLAMESAEKVRKIDVQTALQGAAHDAELKTIAERGSEYAKKCMRREDAAVFVHLLVLEWARLCDDRRGELGFSLDDEQ